LSKQVFILASKLVVLTVKILASSEMGVGALEAKLAVIGAGRMPGRDAKAAHGAAFIAPVCLRAKLFTGHLSSMMRRLRLD